MHTLIVLAVMAVISGILLAIPATREVCLGFWALVWACIGVCVAFLYGLCAILYGICVMLLVPTVVIGIIYIVGRIILHGGHW